MNVTVLPEQQSVAQAALAAHADAIRTIGKRVVRDIVEIGERLTDAKKLAGHGGWLPWLDREFDWTEDTALRFMQCHDLAKNRNLRDLSLPISSLYLLAAPSTPDEARDAVIDRARAGETISVAETKRVIGEAKGRQQPAWKTTTKPPPISEEMLRQRAAAERIRALMGGKTRDDIGPDSTGEVDRLRARVEQLQYRIKRLQADNADKDKRIRELKAENRRLDLLADHYRIRCEAEVPDAPDEEEADAPDDAGTANIVAFGGYFSKEGQSTSTALLVAE